MIAPGIAAAVLAIWLYLVFARGGFWRGRERDDDLIGAGPPRSAEWPAVAAIVPARNEAETVGRAITSLLGQDYAGRFDVILVDDGSRDGTAEIAREAARAAAGGAADRLTILAGRDLPAGWTGKLWAMQQGVEHLAAGQAPPAYILFCDADITHTPDVVRMLVGAAESRRLVLVSIMAKLHCRSRAERWLVPAFIFFFQKLYPFRWVNDPARRIAAAAGGCMLIRREALERGGGLSRLRGALIDDCALAAALKAEGPVWLGLSERVASIRPYPRFNDIRRMVVRSAYAELRFSSLRLVGAVLGMIAIYLVPPVATLFGAGLTVLCGLAAWLLMVVAYAPTLRFYGLHPLRGLLLPLVAAIYTAFTLDSALSHLLGRGGAWKGRYQAPSRRTSRA